MQSPRALEQCTILSPQCVAIGLFCPRAVVPVSPGPHKRPRQAIDSGIRLGEISSTDLEDLLAVLEGEGLLNTEEHQALLALAEARGADGAAGH